MRRVTWHDDEHELVVDAPHTEPVERASCCDCGGKYQFNAEFFRSRALSPPRRCQACRDQRRAARSDTTLRLTGVVERAVEHKDYVFIRSGQDRYFGHRGNTVPTDWPLQVNDVVTFEASADPNDYRQARKLPRAFVIARSAG